MSHWSQDAVFYHIYPLGLCGAPEKNDFTLKPGSPAFALGFKPIDISQVGPRVASGPER